VYHGNCVSCAGDEDVSTRLSLTNEFIDWMNTWLIHCLVVQHFTIVVSA